MPIAIQLAHAGRKASTEVPWKGGGQLPPDHPNGWPTVAPSPVPYLPTEIAPAAPGADRAAGNDDGLQRDAIKLFHCLCDIQPGTQQGAQPAGAPAEYGDIQVAGAVHDVVSAPAQQLQQGNHFPQALRKQGGLRVISLLAPLSV